MKKFLLLATMVLGVVSCMKDQSFEADGGESKVVLSVALPEGATRAAGADSALGAIDNIIDLATKYDIRYVLAVYDDEGRLAKDQIVKTEDEATSTTFELRLVPGRDYRFVVWADFVAEGTTESLHYNTADLTKVTLKDGSLQLPMDESRDAYTAVKEIEKFNNASEVKLTLTRPFAKLRVVTNDMNEIYSELTQATVTYTTEVYTAFNALTAAVAGEAETITEKVALLDEDAYQYTTETGTAKMTLFADYLFGAVDNTVKFSMDIEDATGYDIPTIQFNTNIPVERNHLTTIYGPILTDFNKVTVTIDEAFEGQYTQTEENSFASALKDAENSVEATIELTEDIEWETGAGIGSTPWISDTAETEVLTVEANGHKIVATGKGVGAIRMANGGKLVINNATIVDESVSYAENSWEYGYLEFEGELEFNNCVFVNAVQFGDANVTFNECSFNSNDDNQYAAWICGNKAYFYACAFEGPRAIKAHEAYGSEVEEVVVDGCTFTNIYKKPGIALGTLNADTKVVIKNSTFNNCQAGDQGLYIYETDTDVTTFDFTEENNTVIYKPENKTALKNILSAAVTAGETNVVVDAQGANIGDLNYGLTKALVPAGTTVTIRNAVVEGRSYGNAVNGTVIFEGCSFNAGVYSIHFDDGSGKVIFKNCKLYGWNSFGSTLESVSFENSALEGNGTYALIRSYVDLTLTNCTIDTTNANHADEWPEGIETISPATLTETNVAYVVKSAERLAEAVKEAGKTIALAAGEYTFPKNVAEGVTISCQEGTVFTGNSKLNIKGATVVGATFSNPAGNAVDQTINGTFVDCTFTGSNALRNCYAGETCEFIRCEFSGSGIYGVHFDGGEYPVTFRDCVFSGFNAFAAKIPMVTFERCTFKGNGKSGYNGANLWGNATLKNCEFTFNGTTANEWIDCIKADGTYSFENCTINGVAYTSDNYTSYGDIFSRNNTTVKINGVDCAL